jgi:hypothetical protein
MKTDVNVPSKSKKNYKKLFLLASSQQLTKKAGSGSLIQWYRSADPYPYQNAMNPAILL